jgi:predicted transcriptional regulator of viral defense system
VLAAADVARAVADATSATLIPAALAIRALARGLDSIACRIASRSDSFEAEHPDLAVVAARAPNAAVCFISALSYHNITTQIPSSVHLAVPRGSYHGIRLPIPVAVYRFDPKTFKAALETHHIGGAPLKMYSAARTLVDCFKFRNKIGLDVALEALRLARQRKRVQNRDLLRFARRLRVEKPMHRICWRSNEPSPLAWVFRARTHTKRPGSPAVARSSARRGCFCTDQAG